MEKRPLRDLNERIKQGKLKVGNAGNEKPTPWYNSHGDCLEFQSIDEPMRAQRIDKYLTIYKSLKDERVIGFQIKDVRALIEKHGADVLGVQARFHGNTLLDLIALLLKVYHSEEDTIQRTEGYTSAVNAVRGGNFDKVNVMLQEQEA